MTFVQIRDFVKHNAEKGFVEIHLYDPKAKGRNPAIKREMSATANNSVFYLNGKVTKQTEVRKAREREGVREKDITSLFWQIKELVEKMNIRLGNHCQFLPQVGNSIKQQQAYNS